MSLCIAHNNVQNNVHFQYFTNNNYIFFTFLIFIPTNKNVIKLKFKKTEKK